LPDGSLLYVATGDSGKVRVYRTSDLKPTGVVSLDGPIGNKISRGSFAASVTISADGKTLYALDQANFRVVILDAAKLIRLAEIPTGNYPFGLALSPRGNRLYVANAGSSRTARFPVTEKKTSWARACISRPSAIHQWRHATASSPKEKDSRPRR